MFIGQFRTGPLFPFDEFPRPRQAWFGRVLAVLAVIAGSVLIVALAGLTFG